VLRTSLSFSPMCLLSLSLSLVWLPEGMRRSKVNSTTAHYRAAGISDPIQTDLLPQSQQGSEIRKESSFIVCVQNFGGAALVAPGRCADIVALVL
jgi:hypothetical protein